MRAPAGLLSELRRRSPGRTAAAFVREDDEFRVRALWEASPLIVGKLLQDAEEPEPAAAKPNEVRVLPERVLV
jgi:hypothetical protein